MQSPPAVQPHPAAPAATIQAAQAAAAPAVAPSTTTSSPAQQPGWPAQGSAIVQETHQPDGKVERHYANGQKLLEFANGTRKLTLPDGRQVSLGPDTGACVHRCLLCLTNTLYAAHSPAELSHMHNPLRRLHRPSLHQPCQPLPVLHCPTAPLPHSNPSTALMQVIKFSNGDIKQAYPTGKVEYFYREVATWQTTYASGLEVFYFPSGQVEGHKPGGSKEIVFADGAVRRVASDGAMQDISREELSLAMKAPRPLEYVF